MGIENQPSGENQNFKADKTLNRRQFVNRVIKTLAITTLGGIGVASACSIRERVLINQNLTTPPLIPTEKPTLVPPTETAVSTATQTATATATTTSTATAIPEETMVPTATNTSVPEKPKVIATETPKPFENQLEIGGIDFSDEKNILVIIFPIINESRNTRILKLDTQGKYDIFEKFQSHVLVYQDEKRTPIVNIHDGFNNGQPLEAEKLRTFLEGNFLSPTSLAERQQKLKEVEDQKFIFKQNAKTAEFVIKSAIRTNQEQTNNLVEKPEKVSDLFGNLVNKKSIIIMICSRPAEGEKVSLIPRTSEDYFPSRYFFLLEASK